MPYIDDRIFSTLCIMVSRFIKIRVSYSMQINMSGISRYQLYRLPYIINNARRPRSINALAKFTRAFIVKPCFNL